MNRVLRVFSAILLLSQSVFAQSNSGEIYGRVTDEKKQGLDFASVTALEGGVVKGGKKTDMNGNYTIKPLAPGKYDIRVTYLGYKEFILTGVYVGNDKSVKVDIQLEKKESSATKKDVIVRDYKVKLIDASDPGHKVVTGEQFKNFSSNKIGDLIGTQVGVLQKKGSQ
ncbi:MAG TPA: carboxypeptidase-like regulatory domain-containing protein, partial [Chitinophagaceae bacterium]|nr:carboxypeptidase-like regulatory domain-containing protein [Chitinophagaceae bacterium]